MLTKNLKKLGASRETLLEVWEKQSRCHLEFAVTLWLNSITEKEVKASIMDQDYISCKRALITCCLSPLRCRREKVFSNFWKKLEVNEKFEHWFNLSQSIYSDEIKQQKPTFKPVPFNTKPLEIFHSKNHRHNQHED